MNHILKPVLVALVIVALQGCSWFRQELQEPEIRVTGFTRLPGDNLLDQRFALQLEMTNPNDLELDIKGISFAFEIAGGELLRGVSGDVPLVKPYSQTAFTVQGSANLVQAVNLIRKMHKEPERRFAYTLRTRIDLASGWPSTFNLKRNGELGMQDWLER